MVDVVAVRGELFSGRDEFVEPVVLSYQISGPALDFCVQSVRRIDARNSDIEE